MRHQFYQKPYHKNRQGNVDPYLEGVNAAEACIAKLAQAPSKIIATMRRKAAPGQVRASLSMQHHVFDSEDAAAKFIASVKIDDPNDDFSYVIYPDPLGAGQFIIEVFGSDGRCFGRV